MQTKKKKHRVGYQHSLDIKLDLNVVNSKAVSGDNRETRAEIKPDRNFRNRSCNRELKKNFFLKILCTTFPLWQTN